MEYLELIFIVGIVIFSIVNLISYASRRSDSKNAFRELFDKGEPQREMTAEEEAMVQPFLVNPLKPTKLMPLKGKGVYNLSGEYLRHSLKSKNGESVHDTLGTVDVILPYDSREFIAPWNKAEVVLTDTVAIVITLNEEFDLKGGRERSLLIQEQKLQWAEGKIGEIPDDMQQSYQDEDLDDESTEVEELEEVEIPPVRILGQRNETPAEIALRVNAGLGWLPALLLIPAFILLLVSAFNEETYLVWLIPSLLLFAAAFYGIWWPRRMGKPKKVNRVEGCLTVIELQNPNNSELLSKQLFLGDKFPVVIPTQWAKWTTIPPDSIVDVDMRVDDYSVLRFGNALSLDKEERQFPTVYWGKHLLLVIVGIAILIMVGLIVVENFFDDVAHIQAVLPSKINPVFKQPSQFLANPPKVGTMVHIQSQARCQLVPAKSSTPEPIDCYTLRWGGNLPTLPAVELAPDLLRFYQADIINAQRDQMLDTIMQMNRIAAGETYNPYLPEPKIYTIEQFSQLIKTIDQACKGKNNSADQNIACVNVLSILGRAQIKGGFRLIPTDKEVTGGMGWPALVVYANEDHENDRSDTLLLEGKTLADLKIAVTATAEPQVHQVYGKALATALVTQRGGVLIPNSALEYEPNSGQPNVAPAFDAEPELDPKSTNWLEHWAEYQKLGQAKYLKPVDLKGLVIRSEKNQQGDWVLEVDQRRTEANVLFAGLRLAALLLASLLVLIHGSLFYIKLRQSNKREKVIETYRQQQTSVF